MHSFTLLSFAVLTAFGVDASPQPIERRAPAVIPGYDYAGCYTEATYTRALGGASGSDNKMTVNTCAAACAGSTYFGVEYGKECYCGNYLNSGSVAANPSDCSFPCPGDSSQSCGAGGRLSLYKRSTAAYTSKGCYTEATGKRALSDASFYSDSMTVSRCAAVCASYTFFGLEYGRECHCGNVLNAGSVPANNQCNMACGGGDGQFCGANSRLNVYRNGPEPPAPTTTTPALPAQSTL